MVSSMKTTVEISDALLKEAKRVASEEKTTLRALIEAGLRRTLESRQLGAEFHLRDAGFRGKGLQPEFRDGDWQQIRDAAYKGRGA